MDWTYIIGNVLPNNNNLVGNFGTNKTQKLHRLRLRTFKPRQPIPDIAITLREWQPDPEIIITHDDLYARAWECEYEKPIFDSDYINLVTPNSPETTTRSEEGSNELRNAPGTYGEIPQKLSLRQTEYMTDHYMQSEADTSVEQQDSTPTNPRSSKYDVRHNQSQIQMAITDFDPVPLSSTERIRTVSGTPRIVLGN